MTKEEIENKVGRLVIAAEIGNTDERFCWHDRGDTIDEVDGLVGAWLALMTADSKSEVDW